VLWVDPWSRDPTEGLHEYLQKLTLYLIRQKGLVLKASGEYIGEPQLMNTMCSLKDVCKLKVRKLNLSLSHKIYC
jgi:hypothetical protein